MDIQINALQGLTNAAEIKIFLTITIQIGLVKFPTMCDYWSSKPVFGGHFIYEFAIINKFEQL